MNFRSWFWSNGLNKLGGVNIFIFFGTGDIGGCKHIIYN